MLEDPLVVGASYITAADMPCISRETNKSVYQLVVSSTTYTLTIAHQTVKGRRRTNVRLDATKLSADPYVTTQNVQDTLSAYLVIDRSERLSTDAVVLAHVQELLGGTLGFATYANNVTTRTAQIVAGQS